MVEEAEYPERTTDHGQATGKLYHLRLQVECTFFVIYKAGREPSMYIVRIFIFVNFMRNKGCYTPAEPEGVWVYCFISVRPSQDIFRLIIRSNY